MQFNYAYRGRSAVAAAADSTAMSFVPDATREPTYFTAELRQKIEFREAISALHDIVVSDLRFKPKDRAAYKEWAARRETLDWQEIAARRTDAAARIAELQTALSGLEDRRAARWQTFYAARRKYFDYLYQKERDLWFLLDPVITIHPDEVFFECFSEDESSYGRLGANYDVFENIGEFACGTTNIDYSAALYDEFQKIRTYKRTRFAIDPRGFEVRTSGEESLREVKIDVPDSWVRGFLQVSSAMTLPAVRFVLHPLDLHNICFVLRRKKERESPRALRYVLKPNEPVKIVLEPWNVEIVCPRSRYDGADAREIRVWGRRRLLTLERLVPVARRFTVHLLGTGLPSFYVADLGDLNFTLGLSGWTANDWSKAGNFDLLAPRAATDDVTKRRVFEGLKENWYAAPDKLARRLNLDQKQVLGALAAWTQAGRAVYDLNKGVYRVRELARETLPMDKLRFANEREAAAARFLDEKAVRGRRGAPRADGSFELSGTVQENGRALPVTLVIDADERIAEARCGCYFFATNQLFKGPCEHLLALRLDSGRS